MDAIDRRKRKDAINDRSEDIFKAYGVELSRGKCRCPFPEHADNNPSFLAKKDNAGLWYWSCRSCGKSGHDIFSFVAQMEGMDNRRDFPKIIEHCEKICGIVHSDEPPTGATNHKTATPRTQEPAPPPMYLNAQTQAMATKVEQTNLFKYLCQYWEHAEVKRVMELYCVGLGLGMDKDTFKLIPKPQMLQRVNACCSFPSIDTQGNTHAIKIIPYPLTDHHRAKADKGNTQMITMKPGQNPGTYFGTHLLAQDTNKPVALVESEKTAIIGTLFMPAYIWIATGSWVSFNARMVESIGALKPRQIHLFPDSDKAEEWKATANELRALGYNIFVRDEIIKLFPADSGTDIADIIIWEVMNQSNNNY